MLVQEIDSSDLQARISEGDDFYLLDIRSAGEVAQGMLPDSDAASHGERSEGW